VSSIEAAQPSFAAHGWGIARGLFDAPEVAELTAHFMAMRAEGPKPGDYAGEPGPDGDDDPLLAWPRLIHMHRWDARSLRWMLDARLRRGLEALLAAVGRPGTPSAVQTMLYFKPPGARGQALHQDQAYLRASPGTCAAAWLALDRADESNGCMRVVEGSGRLPILAHGAVDTADSFTAVGVLDLPADAVVVPAVMEPGDVLFFTGEVVHGSLPNRSDRFRRALIGHYLSADVAEVDPFYLPALAPDGEPASVAPAPRDGPGVDPDLG